MVVVYEVNFREPWQGIWMSGQFERFVKDYDEALKDASRYENYYKNTYGEEAEIIMYEKG